MFELAGWVILLFIIWAVIRVLNGNAFTEDGYGNSVETKEQAPQQGDLCKHCGILISLPPELDPTCLCCGKSVLE